MKFFFDFLPVILFFGTFKYAEARTEVAAAFATDHLGFLVSGGVVGTEEAPVLLATLVVIMATMLQVGIQLARRKKVDGMLWVSLAIIVVFGGATIYFRDDTFIKWKPTILYWCFAVALLASQLFFKKNLIFFVAAGIFSLRWIYRANSNAHCLNADMSMSPGWNVGWFFVPIATWWKPYEGIRDIWRISANAQKPTSVERPSLLVRWWTFWLLTNIASTVSFRLQFRATEVGSAILADAFDIVSSIALVPATYFFLAIVRDITEMQQRYIANDDATSFPQVESA